MNIESRGSADAIAETAASMPARRLPGESGVWVFILGDLMVFGLFFLTFAYYRNENPALYGEAHRSVNQAFGLINTLLLLTSSWFVATAVHTMRQGVRKGAAGLFALALVCGVGFTGIKVLEYGEKIRAGITLTTNDFFMFYFMFTGIHLAHVLIGMGVLACLIAVSRRAEPTARDTVVLESGGVFWHLVDLLWIVLFALFYLLG
jgi:nitric oxide reductase NorE protein